MKTKFLGFALALLSSSAIAGCTNYEYSELKDMSKKQLVDAYCEVKFSQALARGSVKFASRQLDIGRDFVSQHQREEDLRSFTTASNEVSQCYEPLEKVTRQLERRKVPKEQWGPCPVPRSELL
jgi:hypothetical protein